MFLVKGGDYDLDQVVGREEVEGAGGEVRLIPFIPGRSTTDLLQHIKGKHSMIRNDGRGPGVLRPTQIEMDAVPYAEGSCLISTGNTRVLCAASVQDEVPGVEGRFGEGVGYRRIWHAPQGHPHSRVQGTEGAKGQDPGDPTLDRAVPPLRH